MKENARQGFFNGSKRPFGYRVVEVEIKGNKGKKKRLEVDPSEAVTVKTIFHLYLYGHGGQMLGLKAITGYLNERGMSLRGTKWTRSRVHEVLCNRLYIGELYFNKMGRQAWASETAIRMGAHEC